MARKIAGNAPKGASMAESRRWLANGEMNYLLGDL
jgi:hypothetical protein